MQCRFRAGFRRGTIADAGSGLPRSTGFSTCVCPSRRLGAARAPSPDVRYGHPANPARHGRCRTGRPLSDLARGSPVAQVFQPVSVHPGGSGPPVPRRRTFASGILPCAHCMPARRLSDLARGSPVAQVFQPVSVHPGSSGLPMPRRRSFATGILPCAHCMPAALRHPGSACRQARRRGTGSPSRNPRSARDQAPTPSSPHGDEVTSRRRWAALLRSRRFFTCGQRRH